ncbi:MAG: Ig-like domain-containing protein [Paludibacter sp.]|jgi:hypothetical protein|nr:Ig-like domain-containing protein [Paludibacter sp.]
MKTKTLLLACAVSLFGWQGFAQTPVYQGASLPTEQGWVEQKLNQDINPVAAPTTATVANGALKFTSTNAADQFSQLGWYKTGLGLDLTKGYSIEIKAKLNVAAKGAFNIQGYDNTGKGFRVSILADKLTNQSNPFEATTLVKDGLTNDGEFHVYRFAFAPWATVYVYRDDSILGTFPLSAFQFDNLIENGGFEDADGFPDFLSNGILTRVSDPNKKRYGGYALEMNSNGKVTDGWSDIEGARTRPIAIKPGKEYEIYITRRRTLRDNYAWRDMGAFFNDQNGTLNGVDERNNNITWGGINDDFWQIHPNVFTNTGNKQTVRFEFPSWRRDGVHQTTISSLDNFTFRERMPLTIGGGVVDVAHATPDPIIPAGIVNIIKNGDFENVNMNNDGTPYTWTLASEGGDNSNEPVGYNPMWNGDVRIQDKNKPDDFNGGDEFYAHSGTKALRFSSLNDNARNIDFTVELEANKTYRFIFWHRNPKWNDWCWYFVRIGEQEPIWGHRMGDRANKWIPVDLVFTTTEVNKTLHLYSTSQTHGGWYNQYFDDFTLYEMTDELPLDPQIVGKTNLIANGDFEDVNLNQDGTPYAWALASNNSNSDDDFPMAYNEVWGSWVRLQDKNKRPDNDIYSDRDDTGYDYAHSGTHAMRFTSEWNFGAANNGLNFDFKKELEANKTYTFIFWIKTSVWNDRGVINIFNGDVKVWEQEMTNKYMNWTRQSVTFTTTEADHTLRFKTDFWGWFNFYLDDLFLFEDDYQPALAPVYSNNSYLFFGKSQNTASADIEVEYINIDNTGANIVNEIIDRSTDPHPANVATNEDVKIRFVLDINTLGEPDLRGITISGAMGVAAAYSGNTITITHRELAPNTSYTVTIPAGTVKGYNTDIVWTFKTGNANIEINPVTPVNNSTDADVDVVIKATFSKSPYINGSPKWNLITIKDNAGNAKSGILVSGAGISGNTYNIFHATLAYDTEYTVTIPKDAVTGLADNYSWKFRTKKAPAEVENAETANLTVYPTLTDGKVIVNTAAKAEIRICDLTGRTLEVRNSEGGEYELNFSERASGVYFVVIASSDKTTVTRIIRK